MTKQEKDELFNELLAFLSRSSVSVEDLPEAGSLDDVNSFPAYKKDSKELVTIPSSALKEASNKADAAAQSALSASQQCMIAGANANSAVGRVKQTLNSLPGQVETLVNNSTSAQSNVNSRIINFYTSRPSSNALELEITVSENDYRTFEQLLEEEYDYADGYDHRPIIFTVLQNNGVPKYRKIVYDNNLRDSQNYIDYDLSGLHERIDTLDSRDKMVYGDAPFSMIGQKLSSATFSDDTDQIRTRWPQGWASFIVVPVYEGELNGNVKSGLRVEYYSGDNTKHETIVDNTSYQSIYGQTDYLIIPKVKGATQSDYLVIGRIDSAFKPVGVEIYEMTAPYRQIVDRVSDVDYRIRELEKQLNAT